MTSTTATITATPTNYRFQVQEFIAGFAALAYQIVTFKLILLAGLGDALSVAVSLTSFVAIAGFGAVLAKKVKASGARWVELLAGGIGLTLFGILATKDLASVMVWFGGFSAAPKLAILIFMLSPLAFLPGMLIPLYERLRAANQPSALRHEAFIPVFIAFHAGGALCLIAMENSLFPRIGWVLTGLLVSGVSVINALVNAAAWERTEQARKSLNQPDQKVPDQWGRKQYGLLLGLSILTGMIGIAVYNIFNYQVSPNIRNYTVVTAFIFIGLSVAGVLARKQIRSMGDIFLLSATGMLAYLLVVMVGGQYIPEISWTINSGWAAYYLVAGLTLIPLFSLIGTSIPGAVILGADSGKALFVVSVGNALGYWIYVLSAGLELDIWFWVIGAAIAGLVGFAIKASRGGDQSGAILNLGMIAMAAGVIGLLAHAKGHSTLHHYVLGERIISESQIKERLNDGSQSEKSKIAEVPVIAQKAEILQSWNNLGWGTEHIALNEHHNGELVASEDWLFVGGLQSLKLYDTNSRGAVEQAFLENETLSGGLPVALTQGSQRALVLGAGTGVSAAAISRAFNQTEIIDINPATLSQVAYFANYNDAVYKKARLIERDALSHIAESIESGNRYDYIFNTLTGAGYSFSANVYSREAMTLILQGLQENGIYAFWIDSRISQNSMKALISSAQEVFGHIRIFSLNPAGVSGDSEKAEAWMPEYQVIVASKNEMAISQESLDRTQNAINPVVQVPQEFMERFINLFAMALPENGPDNLSDSTVISKLGFAYDYEMVLETYTPDFWEKTDERFEE